MTDELEKKISRKKPRPPKEINYMVLEDSEKDILAPGDELLEERKPKRIHMLIDSLESGAAAFCEVYETLGALEELFLRERKVPAQYPDIILVVQVIFKGLHGVIDEKLDDVVDFELLAEEEENGDDLRNHRVIELVDLDDILLEEPEYTAESILALFAQAVDFNAEPNVRLVGESGYNFDILRRFPLEDDTLLDVEVGV